MIKRQPEAHTSWPTYQKTTTRSNHQLTYRWENVNQKHTPADLHIRKRQPEAPTSWPTDEKTSTRCTHQLVYISENDNRKHTPADLLMRKRQPDAHTSWPTYQKTTTRNTHQLTYLWENGNQKHTPADLNMRKLQPEAHSSWPLRRRNVAEFTVTRYKVLLEVKTKITGWLGVTSCSLLNNNIWRYLATPYFSTLRMMLQILPELLSPHSVVYHTRQCDTNH